MTMTKTTITQTTTSTILMTTYRKESTKKAFTVRDFGDPPGYHFDDNYNSKMKRNMYKKGLVI